MDETLLSLSLFLFLKVAVFAGVVIMTFSLWRRLRAQYARSESEEGQEKAEFSEFLWEKRWLFVLWAFVVAVALNFFQMEMGYRPKTEIQSDTSVMDQRLRDLDQALAPVVKPAEGDLRDKKNENYSEKNLEENEGARKRFLELPDDNS